MLRPLVPLICALLLSLPAFAGADWRELALDADPQSVRGQALLVLSVDTEVALRRISLARIGGGIGPRLGPFAEGTQLLVLAVPPGRYRIARIELGNRRGWTAPEGAVGEPFDAPADALSYPGDLQLTEVPGSLSLIQRSSNRSAWVLQRLALAQPRLIAELPLLYHGQAPDPFPAFWRDLPDRQGELKTPPLQADPPGQATALDYFRPRAIVQTSLSPDGRLVAVAERGETPLGLTLIDLDSRQRVNLEMRLNEPVRLVWCGNRCLAVSSGGDRALVDVLKLSRFEQSWQARRMRVPAPGYVIDPMPEYEQRLLFGRLDNPSGNDSLEVYRLDLSGQSIDSLQLRKGKRLDRGVRGDFAWISDRRGRLRAAMARQGERYLTLYRDANDDWQVLQSGDPQEQFDPVGLGEDGLYALTDQQRSSRQLVRIDLSSGQATTLYALPDVDLVGVVLDQYDRRPLAVRYFDANRLRSAGLNDEIRRRLARLEARHPGAALSLTRIAVDGKRWLYYTESPTEDGRWWVQDEEGAEPFLLGRNRPWLPATALHAARSLVMSTAEGWLLEAVVVEPAASTQPVPVVVMPHGGPIGVRDSLLFDPEAQYLASQGLAVLQINYRGSMGYGRAFREAGFGAAGGAIEDDVMIALEKLLEDPRYDRNRVCAMGASYGGYSSLMLAIRFPERFRCVVALAAVTDLPLRFSSSDWNKDPLQAAFQRRLYGDPEQALQTLVDGSPVYRYREIQTPVLLGHGGDDRRVDPEHSRRLALVLARAGSPTPVLLYPDEGHGLERPDHLVDWFRRAAGFIHQQLGDPPRAEDGLMEAYSDTESTSAEFSADMPAVTTKGDE